MNLIRRFRARLCWLLGHEWGPVAAQLDDQPPQIIDIVCVHCFAPGGPEVARRWGVDAQ